MIRFIKVLLFTLSLLPYAYALDVKVMTYNITGSYHGYLPNWSETRSGDVTKLIEFASPDIFALQEDTLIQRNDVSSFFSGSLANRQYILIDFSHPSNECITGIIGESSCSLGSIFYDPKLFDLVGSGVESSRARWVKFKPKYGNIAPFYLYNTHWAHGRTDADDIKRISQATAVANDMWSRVGKSPVVYVGDFNSRIGLGSFEYLLDDIGVHPYSYHPNHRKFQFSNKSEADFTFFNDVPAPSKLIRNSFNEFRIDHILTTEELAPGRNYTNFNMEYRDSNEAKSICDYVVVDATKHCSPSDHRAVMATITLPTRLDPSIYYRVLKGTVE